MKYGLLFDCYVRGMPRDPKQAITLEYIWSGFAQLLDVNKLHLYKNKNCRFNSMHCCYIITTVEQAHGKVVVVYFHSHSNLTFIVINHIDGCGYSSLKVPLASILCNNDDF